MWLTVEPPDQRLSQRDNSAEVRQWREVDRRELDTATVQLQKLPPTKWLRKIWSAAVTGTDQPSWAFLPEEVLEACSRGEELSGLDVAFLVRVTSESDAPAAVAAMRTLGLLGEAHPYLLTAIAAFLEKGLAHGYGVVRAAAAEALWAANASSSAPAIREVARNEAARDIKEYMLHAANLLDPS